MNSVSFNSMYFLNYSKKSSSLLYVYFLLPQLLYYENLKTVDQTIHGEITWITSPTQLAKTTTLLSSSESQNSVRLHKFTWAIKMMDYAFDCYFSKKQLQIWAFRMLQDISDVTYGMHTQRIDTQKSWSTFVYTRSSICLSLGRETDFI